MRDAVQEPTPEGHGDGEEDRGGVVEEESDVGVRTAVAQLPEVAEAVAQRAHDDGTRLCVVAADLLASKKRVCCEKLNKSIASSMPQRGSIQTIDFILP